MCTYFFKLIIENDQISFSAKLGVFTVVGTTGNAHAVRLFPKESCTCPSTGSCYHIIAAKSSIGLDVTTKLTIVNLSNCEEIHELKKTKLLVGRSLVSVIIFLLQIHWLQLKKI